MSFSFKNILDQFFKELVDHKYCVLTGLNILHSAAAMYVTYRVLKRLGGSSLSVVIIFVFNMAYLLCGMKNL